MSGSSYPMFLNNRGVPDLKARDHRTQQWTELGEFIDISRRRCRITWFMKVGAVTTCPLTGLFGASSTLNSIPQSVRTCGQVVDRAGMAQSLSIRRTLRGEDAMVGHRDKKLIQRHREMLAQVIRIRLEAKEQAREEWLQRAKAQAARIASRPAGNIPKKDQESDKLPC